MYDVSWVTIACIANVSLPVAQNASFPKDGQLVQDESDTEQTQPELQHKTLVRYVVTF